MTGAPLESDYPAATAVEADRLENAWRWLQADVKRVAGVFAQQVLELTDDICAGLPNTAVQQDAVDVTVKLELLRKGKCPRFHLDKVRRKYWDCFGESTWSEHLNILTTDNSSVKVFVLLYLGYTSSCADSVVFTLSLQKLRVYVLLRQKLHNAASISFR